MQLYDLQLFSFEMVEDVLMKEQRGNRPTKKQEQIIHVLEHQLMRKELLDERGYRLLLTEWFGRHSSRDLTREEASSLIERLVKMGGVITPPSLPSSERFREESSISGLRKEVIGIARERYGENFEKPLAALCRKLNIPDYRSMDVRHGKALKETLIRLQSEGPYVPGRESSEETATRKK